MTEKRILLIGSGGFLGSSFKGNSILKPTKNDFDITNYDSMESYVKKNQFSIIINCAAIVGTDVCEKDPILANEVNSFGVSNLIMFCKEYKKKLVHFSTMYSGFENVYSMTKKLSELYIMREYNSNHCVIRLPWLFGKHGGNSFIETMINDIKEGKDISVFKDNGFMAYTNDISSYVLSNINNLRGMFDLYNGGIVDKSYLSRIIGAYFGILPNVSVINRKINMVINPLSKDIVMRDWMDAFKEYLSTFKTGTIDESRTMQSAAQDSMASR